MVLRILLWRNYNMNNISLKILTQQNKIQESNSIVDSFFNIFYIQEEKIKELETLKEQKESFIQRKIEDINEFLSYLQKSLKNQTEKKDKVVLIKTISEYTLLRELLELFLMSDNQVDNIKKTAKGFETKAQSSVQRKDN